MNSVDRMNQICSINPARRREARVEMSVFTMLLDVAVNNAFALYTKIEPEQLKGVSFCEFKRKICTRLLTPYLNEKKKHTVETLRQIIIPNATIPLIACVIVEHMLVANLWNKKQQHAD